MLNIKSLSRAHSGYSQPLSSAAPPGSEPEYSEGDEEIKKMLQEIWKQQMLAQQNAFLTLAGLEITALTIYAGINKGNITPLFFLPVALVVIQVSMAILLMNAERETSWGNRFYLEYRNKG